MQTVTTIGLDIAKSVFQIHGIDAAGEVVIRRQLKRPLIGNRAQSEPKPRKCEIDACDHRERGNQPYPSPPDGWRPPTG